MKWTVAAVAWAAALTLSQAAEDITLKVGDPAPKLQVAKWLQGEPVKGFEKDKTYIVEFWATWCGPCRVSIPHLNELHEKFKDKGLIVIGQDVWERNEDEVPKFVQKMGEKMTYRVALDAKNGDQDRGRMAETWMQAAGQNGIPTAFVVDKKGTIAWIGHPMTLNEKLLEEVLAGTFDVKKAAAEFEEKEKSKTALQTTFRDFSRAMSDKDWSAAETALKKADELLPESQRKMLQMPRFNMLIAKKDYKAAYGIAREVSEASLDNALLQNQLAWQILTDKKIEERDLALAETIARRGVAASKEKDSAILDTLARALFDQGKKDEAIKTQQKAVDVSDGEAKEKLQSTLDSYKKGKLPSGQE
ncbi:MAG: redoxin family protein [Verrucomicrobia bacterium]|nr:redoxin family protein [Verrucomicrobiota bacterium]